ncbi:unnamed protein product [Heterobilharzia americana]|nr:unnamed protein product [Heterobilharzia americana]
MVTRRGILNLYKSLLSYVNSIEHSDRGYLRRRIQSKFKESKMCGADDAAKLYEV